MHYYIGWDVGAWGCRSSSKSQDALVVLTSNDEGPSFSGNLWRGNLSKAIIKETSLEQIVNDHCGTAISPADTITIAIDTPLGLPAHAVSLFAGTERIEPSLDVHSSNSFIYRQTEVWLARIQFPPLSAIKDMIGSQATKGMYLLRKFGLRVQPGQCGVWSSKNVTAIECYPTTCKRSDRKGYICHGSPESQALYSTLMANGRDVATDDEEDAVYCALVAYAMMLGC